jgi:hypothetical protein
LDVITIALSFSVLMMDRQVLLLLQTREEEGKRGHEKKGRRERERGREEEGVAWCVRSVG